jgi:hypothetical protein
MTFLEGWGARLREGAIFMGYFRFGAKAKKYLGNAVDLIGQATKNASDKIKENLKKK